MTTSWPFHDPLDVLDYGFNWKKWIKGSDTITATTADVQAGSTLQIDSHELGEWDGVPTGMATITWLSGGAAGETALIDLHIVMASGRQVDQTVSIEIKERT